jgi:hypothetical protein
MRGTAAGRDVPAKPKSTYPKVNSVEFLLETKEHRYHGVCGGVGRLARPCLTTQYPHPASSSREAVPLDRCNGAVQLEILSAVKGTFLVEMLEDQGMDRCERP